MIGARWCPVGRVPSSSAVLISASLQLPMPVSRSGVMLEAVKRERCPLRPSLALRSRRGGRFRLRLCLRLLRARVLSLRCHVAINQLNDRDGSGIAVAEAGLQHPGIASVAILVTGAQHLEQFLDHSDIA